MKITDNQLLAKIKEIVLGFDRQSIIYLYGSHSRGTATGNSDWDLLILLDIDIITPEMERAITYPIYDLEFDTGEIISPMLYTIDDWNNRYSITAFYKNVMKEGIMI